MEPTTGLEPVNLFLTKEVLYLLSYVGPREGTGATRERSALRGRVGTHDDPSLDTADDRHPHPPMQCERQWLPKPPLSPTWLEKFPGGEGRIRTSEGFAGRFTVCSLWPLGNLSNRNQNLAKEPQPQQSGVSTTRRKARQAFFRGVVDFFRLAQTERAPPRARRSVEEIRRLRQGPLAISMESS